MSTSDRLVGVSNWRTWQSRIKGLLKLRNLLGHIDGTELCPPIIPEIPAQGGNVVVPADDTAGIAWDALDHHAVLNIVWNMINVDGHGI
jgi:hypothetical protein